MALYALYAKKLTIPGIIVAWLFGFIIITFGGNLAFAAAALMIALILIFDRIKKGKKDKKRDMYQIISNLLTPTLSILLLAITDNNIFYTMYFAGIACALGDTLASSIGSLSKGKPFSIITFKMMEKGESGGVSHLGNFAALMGGFIIGALYFAFTLDKNGFILITVMGFIGSTVDTILGTLVQAQYRCYKCKKVIEEKKHCRVKTKLIKGYPFVDNNLVNLLANTSVFFLSYLILI